MNASIIIPILIAVAVAGVLSYIFLIQKKKPAAGIPPATTPSTWTFMYGANETGTPENFTFPSLDGVHYCMKSAAGYGVAIGKTITFKFDLSGDGELKVADPNDAPPATVRLILQRRGDTLSQIDYRFWFDTKVNLVNGQLQLVAPIDGDRWSNVNGQKNAAGLQALINDIANVGFTFGGQSFAGHGIYCPVGMRAFKLIEYSVA